MLDVGGGHRVYWETSGNPEGMPALMIHGGPGSGSTPGNRRNWDPARYRIIQMDQRNAGRSTPSASDPAVTLAGNTTADLVADVERLREHLGVDRWVVYGSSWGTVVALVYAEKFPERVRALILVYLFLARRRDIRWLYYDVGRYFPEEWHRFAEVVSAVVPDGDIVEGYRRLLNESGDEDVQRRAAQSWCDWEDTVRSLEPGWMPSPKYADPDFRLRFARVVTHYFSRMAFLDDDQILRDAHRLGGIPGVAIHGRLDTGNPVELPWLLAREWPDLRVHILEGVGHSSGPETLPAILAATERFSDAG